MRQKVSDYIADFLANAGIRDIFTVPGGLAMHMNDSFGHHPLLKCTYQHHEQACAMAAEAYARYSGKMAAVCVTAGPGTTNAVTGVLGCWMGSIPMIVLSGQTRTGTSVEATGLPLRSRGIQECEIVEIVKPITKYAVKIRKIEELRYHLEKAVYLAKSGRPGPVWIDIPLDMQGGSIETEELVGFDPGYPLASYPERDRFDSENPLEDNYENPRESNSEKDGYAPMNSHKDGHEKSVAPGSERDGSVSVNSHMDGHEKSMASASKRDEYVSVSPHEDEYEKSQAPNSKFLTMSGKDVPEDVVRDIVDRLENAQRPVLLPGFGVRLAGAHDLFIEMAELLGVPVVTGVSSVDAIAYDHPLYVGRCGGTGDRAGNFAVQNSDVFFSNGCRLSYSQTGFNTASWAREAYKIIADIDINEPMKADLGADLPLGCDAKILAERIIAEAKARGATRENPLNGAAGWRQQCRKWKEKYRVVTSEHYRVLTEGRTNIYAFYDRLSDALPDDAILMVSVGTSRVVGSQVFRPKAGQRFITNSNTASMGFDLPAIVGISRAEPGKTIVCVTGEGCLMMNLQEFMTLRQNGIPFRLFVINNEGYHSVRQTQRSFFKTSLVGVGEESGDLSFPDLGKLGPAFGFAYRSCHAPEDLESAIRETLEDGDSCICEIFVTKEQYTEPKTSSRRLEDGSMVSAPLEDMYPFLPREELAENMYIALEPESIMV